MIISVFLLHNKQHGALSFSESKRHASYICTVGEPCICRFCNWPTNPSRFLRPDCCCWQLISLLNARADSWGEKLGLLKSVTKSCSFHLSRDFMFDAFISAWAGESFWSTEHGDSQLLVTQRACKWLGTAALPCPELGQAGAVGLSLPVPLLEHRACQPERSTRFSPSELKHISTTYPEEFWLVGRPVTAFYFSLLVTFM